MTLEEAMKIMLDPKVEDKSEAIAVIQAEIDKNPEISQALATQLQPTQ